MGTKSLIGIEDKGVVKYTYCQYDSHVECVGKTLLMNYQDKEKINKLIKLKNISSLYDNLEDIEYLTTEDSHEVTLSEFEEMSNEENNMINYFYLFTNNTWYYSKDGECNLLTQRLKFVSPITEQYQDLKKFCLKNNKTIDLKSVLAKILNYDYELAFINKEQAYNCFIEEFKSLKLSSEQLYKLICNIIEGEVKQVDKTKYKEIIAREIIKIYESGERTYLIGVFEDEIQSVIEKYFFSIFENSDSDNLVEYLQQFNISFEDIYANFDKYSKCQTLSVDIFCVCEVEKNNVKTTAFIDESFSIYSIDSMICAIAEFFKEINYDFSCFRLNGFRIIIYNNGEKLESLKIKYEDDELKMLQLWKISNGFSTEAKMIFEEIKKLAK
ncbi:hypothetical protein CSUB8523_0721 [Campylobacter subantarcticus LMG 24377]|uniref:Uncharacterized protein n=1 Tax=Campylobacter subantarcticus TaxID=497724 RepID=A0ABW9N6I7_9BACT|nr:hypothetical protein [Campylobacter subantarcticus]AJC92245.1 hypothetical protein CSUB8523_0721 [Campylobacter subantarcticus LMG 24377]EAL3938330.1 hypothetical protein [Campylobacter lari]MPB99868.1 hypothetical protein [Campylobacter subantarcticus]